MRFLKSSTITVIGFLVLFCAARSQPALAQAWVAQKGEGSVNFAYQHISNTGHRLSDGSADTMNPGRSVNMGLYLEGEYALTDRLSFSAGIPFVFSKYTDPGPTPGPPEAFLPVDSCRCWHSGFQDFNVTARYNILNENFALTPSVSFGSPSQGYDYRGEAVIGTHLNEARFAIDAGKRLDFISPKLSVQGGYSYAFVERPLDDVKHDRSNVALQAGFFATRRLLVRGVSLWQHTHGGLRVGPPGSSLAPPGEVNTPERFLEHDRILKDNYWRVGGGTTYSFDKMDVFLTYVHYATGGNTHMGRALTVGVSVPFQLGGN